MIAVETIQQDHLARLANAPSDPTKYEEECFVCGRGMTSRSVEKAWHVHVINGGDSLVQADDDSPADNADLGWFPVGSECAKSIPVTYRRRWSS